MQGVLRADRGEISRKARVRMSFWWFCWRLWVIEMYGVEASDTPESFVKACM